MSKKKLAIILSRFPYPLDKGDKLRAYHQITHLSKTFDVYLYCLSDEKISESSKEKLKPYCRQIEVYSLSKWTIFSQVILSFFSKIPVQVGYFFSPSIKRNMSLSIQHLNPDFIYCQLSRTAYYGKDLPFKKVIDFQDAFSINYDRIQNNYSGIRKWFYQRESKLMKIFEANMLTWFDGTTIISEFDKKQIGVAANQMVVVSNGVDSSFFRPEATSKKFDILFSGNLAYLPNKKAVEYLIEKIAPLLIQRKPDIRIEIVGASGDLFKKWETKNIHIQGWVEDIRQSYLQSKIFVAPLFTGAGLQNKLLEAMSCGIPCVTTSVTNASLQATENSEVFIANEANEFVDKILLLLENEELQNTLSVNARKYIETKFSWEQANQKLVELFERIDQ